MLSVFFLSFFFFVLVNEGVFLFAFSGSFGLCLLPSLFTFVSVLGNAFFSFICFSVRFYLSSIFVYLVLFYSFVRSFLIFFFLVSCPYSCFPFPCYSCLVILMTLSCLIVPLLCISLQFPLLFTFYLLFLSFLRLNRFLFSFFLFLFLSAFCIVFSFLSLSL